MTSIKRNFIFLLFNLLFSLQNALFTSDTCTELKDLLHKSYSEIILYITKNINNLKEKQQSCIDVLIKNGKLEELDYYLNELAKKGVDYRENLSVSINTMKRALDEINNKHRFEKKEYQTVSPAFKWAQSLDDIFLEIKFAHRHDSPGCLEIKDMNVDIKNDSVKFEGYCVLGDVPIKIDFRIDTFKSLNVSECSHGASSVGRYQITLKKGEKSFWKKLLKDDFPVPPNMRVWFEMKEKYQEELKEFEEKEEKENDNIDKLLNKIDKKRKKEERKKKKEKKVKGTNTNETHSESHDKKTEDNKVKDDKKTNKTTDL
jgi:hypothetical protein